MSSVVIYGNEFTGQIQNGLSPNSFKYRFLVEGDSWMDRSAMFHTSLLQQLAPEMDKGFDDCLFINIAMFGDTIRRMSADAPTDFERWLRTAFSWKFDAILLSAGGNDFIDAARDPDAGQGILKNLAGAPIPVHGTDCLDVGQCNKLIKQWLNPSFETLYACVQRSRHKDTPIFLNSYDTPTARQAPVFQGGRSWLAESYIKNSIPPELWLSLTAGVFDNVKDAVNGWANGKANVHVVPTNGTLMPAAAGSTGSDADWLNEIHPNEQGWKKLAKVWRTALKSVLI